MGLDAPVPRLFSGLRSVAIGLLPALLTVLLSCAAQAQPVTHHVHQTDPTCGGLSPCYSTIQAAVDAAAGGDTVRIQAGSYPDRMTISGRNSAPDATEADRIVIEADPLAPVGSVAVAGRSAKCGAGYGIRIGSSRFVTIRGLTVMGVNGPGIALLGGGARNEAIHLERNRIVGTRNSCSTGIAVGRDNTGTLIVNNLVHAHSRDGLFLASVGGTYVVNNTIHANDGAGIAINGSQQLLLVNNAVTQNRTGVKASNLATRGSTAIQVLHNLICGTGRRQIAGLVLDAADVGNLTPSGLEGPAVTASPGCSTSANVYESVTGSDGARNTVDDDFTLAPASPALDRGLDPRTLGLDPSFDPLFEGDYLSPEARLTGFDIGALAAGTAGTGDPGDASPHQAPSVAILLPAAGAVVRGSVTVQATALAGPLVAGLTLRVDSKGLTANLQPVPPVPETTATATWQTTAMANGVHTVTATGTDSTGVTTTATRLVTVDNVPPSTQVTGGPSGTVTATTVTFTFSGADDLAASANLVFAWRLDGGPYSAFTTATTVTLSGLGVGAHAFEVKARDQAGNEAAPPARRDFTVAQAPPPTLFPVSLTTAGAGSGTVAGAGSYAEGAIVTLRATPNPGSTFTGWSGSPPCAPSFDMPAGSVACVATFVPTPPPGSSGGVTAPVLTGPSDLGAWYLFALIGRDPSTVIDPATGLLRTVGVARGTQQVVTAYVRDRYHQLALASGFLLQFLVDGEPIGAPVGPPYEIAWDTTRTPEGTHALSLRVVDRTPGTSVTDPVRPVAISVVVDNVPGAVAGPQLLPVTGSHIQSQHESGAVDWLSVDGTERRWNTPAPLPVVASPSATSMADPAALRAWNQWYAEPLTQPLTTLYHGLPELVETADDHLWIHTLYEQKGGSVADVLTPAFSRRSYDHVDGPRQQNGVDPYSTFIPRPDGPGWWGVDMAGRLFEITPNGTVTTLHGWLSNPEGLPYEYGPETKWVGVKGDTGPWLKGPVDLAADPRNPRIVYVADTGNHRIARVDLTGAVSVVTTLAGVPGTAGYRDGAASQALFNRPYSLAVGADGTIYVADHDNRAIRTISPDGLTVQTLAGQGPSGGATTSQLCSSPATYTGTTTFASASINLPDVLRLDSFGNPIIGEAATRGTIRRLNLATRQVELLARINASCNTWLWLDVDRWGNVGPRDDILVAPFQSNSRMVRLSSAGAIMNDTTSAGWSLLHEWVTVDGAQDAFGHYSWIVAIDDTEAKMLAGGVGSTGGVVQFRRYRPGIDPNGYDHLTYSRGRSIWRTGTVAGFPWASRPAFSALHGPTGHSRLGLPTFDELAEWSDSALTAYIQAGMAGTVPRPELTGADLKALIYFIRRTSLRGGRETISVPVPEADRTAPVVSGVTATRVAPDRVHVRWTTDEPTIGVVSYGRGGVRFAASPIEPAYGTTHGMALTGLVPGVAIEFTITVRDAAGNVSSATGSSP